jgi:hypothetical protein
VFFEVPVPHFVELNSLFHSGVMSVVILVYEKVSTLDKARIEELKRVVDRIEQVDVNGDEAEIFIFAARSSLGVKNLI